MDNSGSDGSVDMAAMDPHWVYQGRQAHGWFGSGTGPGKDIAAGSKAYGGLFGPANVGQRVDYAARSVFVHLPDRDAKHPTAQVEDQSVENLKTAVAAWYGARDLSRDAFRAQLLDPSTKNATVDRLRLVARGIVEARTTAALNAANANLGDAVRRIGLDHWPTYLADAAKRAVAAVDGNTIPGVIKVGTADAAVGASGLVSLGLLMLLLHGSRGQAPKTPPAPAPPVIVHQDQPGDDEKPAKQAPGSQANSAGSADSGPKIEISAEKRRYILTGEPDGDGGGHKPGVGKPNKSEFPADWSDDKIIDEIRSVGDDPGSFRKTIPNGRHIVRGTRDGVDIQILLESDGKTVVTAYPTNRPRNSK